MRSLKYSFTATSWQFEGPAAWVFVSLPVKMSREIRNLLQGEEQGWGRLKARARIGTTEWDTAVWFDTRHNAYLLPLKAFVRKKEGVLTGRRIKVSLWI